MSQLNGAYYGPSIPPPTKTYHRPGRRGSGGGGGCCCNPFTCLCGCLLDCILALVCQIICTVLVIAAAVVFVFWLLFHPHVPELHVTGANLTRFDLSTTNNDTLSYDLNLNMTFRNPNNRIGIYYDYVQVTPYYQGQRFSNSELSPFYLGEKKENNVSANFNGQQLLLLGSKGLSNYDSEKSNGVYGIDVKIHLRIRFKLWWAKTGKFKPRVECDLKVPLNATSGTTFQPTRCHVSIFK